GIGKFVAQPILLAIQNGGKGLFSIASTPLVNMLTKSGAVVSGTRVYYAASKIDDAVIFIANASRGFGSQVVKWTGITFGEQTAFKLYYASAVVGQKIGQAASFVANNWGMQALNVAARYGSGTQFTDAALHSAWNLMKFNATAGVLFFRFTEGRWFNSVEEYGMFVLGGADFGLRFGSFFPMAVPGSMYKNMISSIPRFGSTKFAQGMANFMENWAEKGGIVRGTAYTFRGTAQAVGARIEQLLGKAAYSNVLQGLSSFAESRLGGYIARQLAMFESLGQYHYVGLLAASFSDDPGTKELLKNWSWILVPTAKAGSYFTFAAQEKLKTNSRMSSAEIQRVSDKCDEVIIRSSEGSEAKVKFEWSSGITFEVTAAQLKDSAIISRYAIFKEQGGSAPEIVQALDAISSRISGDTAVEMEGKSFREIAEGLGVTIEGQAADMLYTSRLGEIAKAETLTLIVGNNLAANIETLDAIAGVHESDMRRSLAEIEGLGSKIKAEAKDIKMSKTLQEFAAQTRDAIYKVALLEVMGSAGVKFVENAHENTLDMLSKIEASVGKGMILSDILRTFDVKINKSLSNLPITEAIIPIIKNFISNVKLEYGRHQAMSISAREFAPLLEIANLRDTVRGLDQNSIADFVNQNRNKLEGLGIRIIEGVDAETLQLSISEQLQDKLNTRISDFSKNTLLRSINASEKTFCEGIIKRIENVSSLRQQLDFINLRLGQAKTQQEANMLKSQGELISKDIRLLEMGTSDVSFDSVSKERNTVLAKAAKASKEFELQELRSMETEYAKKAVNEQLSSEDMKNAEFRLAMIKSEIDLVGKFWSADLHQAWFNEFFKENHAPLVRAKLLGEEYLLKNVELKNVREGIAQTTEGTKEHQLLTHQEQVLQTRVEIIETQRAINEADGKGDKTTVESLKKVKTELENKMFEQRVSMYEVYRGDLNRAIETRGGVGKLFEGEYADVTKIRSEICKEVFGKEFDSLSAQEAELYTMFVVESNFKTRTGSFDVRSSQFKNQMETLSQNLRGNIAALSVAGGKSTVYTMVFGIKSSLEGSGAMKGELLVSAESEVNQFITPDGQYQSMAKALGFKFVDGKSFYERRGTDGLDEIQRHLNSEENIVIVWDINSRGHLTREMQGNDKLQEAMGKINVRGIDEADVGALLSKAFIVGITEKAGMEFVDHIEGLVTEINSKLGEVKASEIDDSFNTRYAFAKNPYTSEIIVSRALGEYLISKGYKSGQIKDAIRAMSDKEGVDYVFGEGADKFSAHKASWKGGAEFGTKDNSWTYNVTLGLMRLAQEKGNIRLEVEREGSINGWGKEKIEAEIDTRIEKIKSDFEVSRTGQEATLSQVFVRNSGIDVLTFGGSGTMDVARELAKTIYGRNVVEILESSFSADNLRVESIKRVENGKVEGKSKSEFAADFAVERYNAGERGSLIRLSTPEMLREAVVDILKKLNPDKIGMIDSLEKQTRDNPRLIDKEKSNGLLDLARNKELGLKGAEDISIIDSFTDANDVSRIAVTTGKGKMVLATDMAGRAHNFGGNLRERWELSGRTGEKDFHIDLLIMDAQQLGRGDLLQWLGRTKRGGETDVSDRMLIYDREAFAATKDYLKKVSEFFKANGINSDMQRKIDGMLEKLPEDLNIEALSSRESMESFMEEISSFTAMVEKSNSIIFKINSESSSKLVKEPLTRLIDKVGRNTEAGEYLLAKEKEMLQQKSDDASIYHDAQLKAGEDVGLNALKANLKNGLKFWSELAMDPVLRKLNSESAFEAHRRANEIIKALDKLEAKERSGDVKSENSEKTFADVDILRPAQDVVDASLNLVENILPTESSSMKPVEKSKTAEKAGQSQQAVKRETPQERISRNYEENVTRKINNLTSQDRAVLVKAFPVLAGASFDEDESRQAEKIAAALVDNGYIDSENINQNTIDNLVNLVYTIELFGSYLKEGAVTMLQQAEIVRGMLSENDPSLTVQNFVKDNFDSGTNEKAAKLMQSIFSQIELKSDIARRKTEIKSMQMDPFLSKADRVKLALSINQLNKKEKQLSQMRRDNFSESVLLNIAAVIAQDIGQPTAQYQLARSLFAPDLTREKFEQAKETRQLLTRIVEKPAVSQQVKAIINSLTLDNLINFKSLAQESQIAMNDFLRNDSNFEGLGFSTKQRDALVNWMFGASVNYYQSVKMREANNKFQNGDIAAAIQGYNAVIEDPESSFEQKVFSRLMLADIYANPQFNNHNPAQAKAQLEAAKSEIESGPVGAKGLDAVIKIQVYVSLSDIYAKEGKKETRVQMLERAAEIADSIVGKELTAERAQVYFDLGAHYAQEQDYAKAETYLNKGIELMPEIGSAHYNLGIVYLKESKFDEAGESFTKAIEYLSNDDALKVDAYLGSVLTLKQKGKIREAEELMKAGFKEISGNLIDEKYRKEAAILNVAGLIISKQISTVDEAKGIFKTYALKLDDAQAKELIVAAVQLAGYAQQVNPDQSKGTASISSINVGNEDITNPTAAASITKIHERQKSQGLLKGEKLPGSLEGDLELVVDGIDVHQIEGQIVILVDADYLSKVEDKEQHVSAGLQRGTIYMTRKAFNDAGGADSELVKSDVRHEKEEVAYLRQKARQMNPKLDERSAYAKMSELLKDPQRSERAKTIIGSAHISAVYNEGVSYMGRGENERALDKFEEALDIAGSLEIGEATEDIKLDVNAVIAGAHMNIGTILSEEAVSGNTGENTKSLLSEAQEHFKTALEYNTADNAPLHYNLAVVQMRQGDFEESLSSFEQFSKAAEQSKEDSMKELAGKADMFKEQLSGMMKINQAIKPFQNAIDSFDEGFKVKDKDKEEAKKHYDTAIEQFKAIIESSSGDSRLEKVAGSAQFNLGLSYLQRNAEGDSEKAKQAFGEFIASVAGNGNLIEESYTLARAYSQANNIVERLENIKALEADEDIQLIRANADMGEITYTDGISGEVIVGQITGKLNKEGNALVLSNKLKSGDKEISVLITSKVDKQDLEQAGEFVAAGRNANSGLLSETERQIVDEIRGITKQEDIEVYSLGVNADNISGFANKEGKIFISEALLKEGTDIKVKAAAVFLESAKVYFGQDENKGLLKGMSSDTYVLGARKEVKEAAIKLDLESQASGIGYGDSQSYISALNEGYLAGKELTFGECALIHYNWNENGRKGKDSVLGLQDILIEGDVNTQTAAVMQQASKEAGFDVTVSDIKNLPSARVQDMVIEKVEITASKETAEQINILLSGYIDRDTTKRLPETMAKLNRAGYAL
ncbi:MAG: tetratricopeptide repeat protein, partial [Candidatus Omnitrophica bacterium]|nr:tetratricopeptide repeat protein [Candidatus Omnitrophota bacterium]